MNIVLTGFMASGKTAVGRQLAQRRGMSYLDIDATIEKDTGLSIAMIFEKRGERAFRDLETAAVKCAAMLDNFVIATGGGVVLRQENMIELRRAGKIIYLSATPEVLLKRVGNASTRPLLAKEKDKLGKIREMLAQREPFYRECDLAIDTSALGVAEVIDIIIAFIEGK
jgi:shikimate kinase